MSAICGVYHRDGSPAVQEEPARMVAALAYRGPDGSGSCVSGSVGVGALLLRTTPQAQPAPLIAERGGLVLAADARLDNREELAATLGFDRHAAILADDTDLIGAAYRRWGEGAPHHLLGDFAFAVWDPARQRFFCARDHLGVKQLYYYCSPRLFAFATEIKALLTIPAIRMQLNEARLGDLLTLHMDNTQATLYENILRLPAATSISVDPHNRALHTYWTLDPQREIRLRDDTAYAEAYHDLLGQAVGARLRTSRPVGAALSGGLDSSSITALASDLLAARGEQPLHTISAVYDMVPACDERPYIAAVVERGKVQPHYVTADQIGPLVELQRGPWQEDEPLWSPQASVSWLVYQEAQRRGVGVFLEGMFGDDVVGTGAGYLGGLLRGGHWLRLAHEAGARASMVGSSRRSIIAGQVRQLAPEPLRRAKRRLRAGAQTTPSQGVPLRPEFVRRTGLAARWASTGDTVMPRGRSPREIQWRLLTNGVWQAISLAFVDRMAARCGIEVRQPFLDRRLVEFCLALPTEQKLHDGWSRWIARTSLDGILPDEVRWRRDKSNLTPAFVYGLTHHDRALLDDIILSEPGPIVEYVDMGALQTTYRRFIAQPNAANSFSVWTVASLGLWLRQSCLMN